VAKNEHHLPALHVLITRKSRTKLEALPRSQNPGGGVMLRLAFSYPIGLAAQKTGGRTKSNAPNGRNANSQNLQPERSLLLGGTDVGLDADAQAVAEGNVVEAAAGVIVVDGEAAGQGLAFGLDRFAG